MDSRAVPLRMEIFPSHLSRNGLICRKPWPRPGSRKRLTFWMSAASSAAPSPQRSPNRFACVLSRERRKPIPASLTAMTDDTTTETAPKGIRLHGNPATGAGVLHNILTRLRKRHTESAGRRRARGPARPRRIRAAVSEIRLTASCTSSMARTGVTSSNTSDGPGGRHLGHLAVELEELSGVTEEAGPSPVRLHFRARRHRAKSGRSRPASASAWPAVSMPIRP